MSSDLESRIQRALAAGAAAVPDAPQALSAQRRRIDGRTARRRPMAAAAAAFVAVAATAAVLLLLPVHRTGPTDALVIGEGAGSGATAVPCEAPAPGRGVPDCAVQPADVGVTGTPDFLPQGWSLRSEIEEPIPTGTDRRLQSLQRRYAGPDQSLLLITVTFGDVDAPDPQAFGATVDATIRTGTDVLVLTSDEGQATRYLWEARPRVVVDVDLLNGALLNDELRRVVASVRP